MYNDICKILKSLRRAKNLSQKQLAREINLSQAAYSLYEHGTRKPSLEILIKLADYYNVSLDYLVGRLIIS